MSNYKCAKCDQLGNSKCAASRSMFLTEGKDNTLVTMIGNMIRYGVSKQFENPHVPTLEIALHSASYARNREMNEAERIVAKEQLGDKYDYYARVPVPPPPYDVQRKKEEEHALNFLLNLKKMDDDTIRRALCSHEWELTAPKCELGCCTKRRKPKAQPVGVVDLDNTSS